MVVLTSFSPPTEGVKHEQPSTKMFVDGRELGTGVLYIAESEVAWKNNATGEGITLLYPEIAVHAVSRDLNRFGDECLFLLTDFKAEMALIEEVERADEDDDDELSESMEVRFVPADKGALDAMYTAMCHCQALNPDPNDILSEDENDEYLDANEGGNPLNGGDSGYLDEVGSGRANGHPGGNHGEYDSAMDTDPGQFEDAED